MRGWGRGFSGGRGDGGWSRFVCGRLRESSKFGNEGWIEDGYKDGGGSVRRVGRLKVWWIFEDVLEVSFGY